MQDSKVRWHRAYLAPPSNLGTELSALYQPRQGVAFHYWDPASKYKYEGKDYYDPYFFYYKNGKFVTPTVTAPSGVNVYSTFAGDIGLSSRVPVEGDVIIDFGIGDRITMKLDTYIRSASLCRSDGTVYKTVQKGGTATVSKKDLPGAYGDGEGLSIC